MLAANHDCEGPVRRHWVPESSCLLRLDCLAQRRLGHLRPVALDMKLLHDLLHQLAESLSFP
jgi:hypothetical protein